MSIAILHFKWIIISDKYIYVDQKMYVQNRLFFVVSHHKDDVSAQGIQKTQMDLANLAEKNLHNKNQCEPHRQLTFFADVDSANFPQWILDMEAAIDETVKNI